MYAPRAILSNLEQVGKDWSVLGAICGNFPRFGVRFFPIVAKLERIARGALNCRAFLVSSKRRRRG